jgi:hypothetical protein
VLVTAIVCTTQSWAQWTQLQELTASDGAAFDEFGTSVAMSGNLAVVGAPQHMVGSNAQQGAAYVFVQSGGTWALQAELIAPDGAGGDYFGSAVAISGNLAVVGAPQKMVGSSTQQGAAYVFVQSGGTWTLQAELIASDGASSDEFGTSVAISGNLAVVGAPQRMVGTNTQQGGAYVFVQSGVTWSQQAELTAGGPNTRFGSSAAISGSTAVVGAPGNFALPITNYPGEAYVFVQSGGTWMEQARLSALDGAADDSFGASVAFDGSTAVVGAPNHPLSTQAGQAYTFTQSGGTWSQQAELFPPLVNGALGYGVLGTSVAVSGSTAVVGGPGTGIPDSGGSAPGTAYVFTQSAGTWSQQAQLIPNTAAGSGQFGSSAAISGNLAMVGGAVQQVGSNAAQGAAYVFAPAVVTITGSPQQPLTTDGNGNFVAQVTITNTGNVTISSLQVTSATLGSGSLSSSPAPVTNLAPGGSAAVTLTFPSNSVSPGVTSAPLKLSGTYSVTSPAINGNWALSFRGVTL